MDSGLNLAFIGTSTGGGEIIIILVAALILFGSKNLPSIARNIGKSMEAFRRASREVTDEIMRADIDDKKPASAPRSLNQTPTTASVESPEPEWTVKPSAHAVDRHEPPPAT